MINECGIQSEMKRASATANPKRRYMLNLYVIMQNRVINNDFSLNNDFVKYIRDKLSPCMYVIL